MSRLLPPILFAVLSAAGPAMAATGIEPAIGATLVSTHPDGRQAKLRLAADHSYRAEGRTGARSSGTWKVKGEKLCLSQKRPYPSPFPYCRAFRHAQVGDRWKDKAFNGEPVTNELRAGQ